MYMPSVVVLVWYYFCSVYSYMTILQCELVSLQSSIKRAEVNLQASNMKVERLEKVLTDILYQVGDFISAVQNNSKANSEHNQVVCIEPYLQI
jgi:hypothetical protein